MANFRFAMFLALALWAINISVNAEPSNKCLRGWKLDTASGKCLAYLEPKPVISVSEAKERCKDVYGGVMFERGAEDDMSFLDDWSTVVAPCFRESRPGSCDLFSTRTETWTSGTSDSIGGFFCARDQEVPCKDDWYSYFGKCYFQEPDASNYETQKANCDTLGGKFVNYDGDDYFMTHYVESRAIENHIYLGGRVENLCQVYDKRIEEAYYQDCSNEYTAYCYYTPKNESDSGVQAGV